MTFYEKLRAADKEKLVDEAYHNGILSPGKKEKWNAGTVKAMLSNEKYKGDALLQKVILLIF